MCLAFFVKYLLFFFNLFFWLASIALIAIGAAVLTSLNLITDQIPVNLTGIPIAVIAGGCIIFVIAFSGCYGAIAESRCWLIMYAVFMIILAAGKSYLAYVVFSQLEKLPGTVERWINDAFLKNPLGGPFQIFETTFQCCGSTGADSYTALGLPIPPTCCPDPDNNLCPAEFSYKGCSARLGNYLESYGEAVGGVLITLIIIEVVAMLAAFYMNSVITRRNQSAKVY